MDDEDKNWVLDAEGKSCVVEDRFGDTADEFKAGSFDQPPMNVPHRAVAQSWRPLVVLVVHMAVLLLDVGDRHIPLGGGLHVAAVLLPLKLSLIHLIHSR